MDLALEGKTVLVTGGSKGIGRAIVESFLAEGARVANVNRSADEGLAMQQHYASQGRECLFVQADLCDVDACRNAVETAARHFGRIDILVNNAGVNDSVGLDAEPRAFVASLERNLIHVYAVTHYAISYLRASRGAIINIGSKVSVTGQGGTSGYAAAKAGINGLTREWALDLARDGVRVNAVIPAETWTPLYESILAQTPNPAASKRAIEQLVPFEHRFTTSQEIADSVVFLASPRSSHTTGQIVFVDGGYTHLDRKCTQSFE